MNHDEVSKNQESGVCLRGNEGAEATGPAPSESELKKLDEAELKAAVKSAWKNCERLAKEEMAELLYWLREKIRVQGGQNDIHDKDSQFGGWVEEHLCISRHSASRWADESAKRVAGNTIYPGKS